ncbi:MAG: hypothetical protein ISN28_02900 [Ectothiorhodospiraceae bacterium AqS1]|nr:hypothetical protein [Ectothiorhodospiraceae bacterium AqS1]
MMIMSGKSGGRFEEIGAYSRVKRIGPHIWVAGTAAIEPSGRIHAPGDCYAQTRYILGRIERALEQVGAGLIHVARVRCYLADMSQASEFVRAHGEVFRGIDPALTAVAAGLSQPELVVEIEVDAMIHEPPGAR